MVSEKECPRATAGQYCAGEDAKARQDLRFKPLDEGFRRQERLRKTKEFADVYKNSVFRKGYFLKIFVAASEKSLSRIGISVSKKHIPNSSSRNKLKRLVREIYRKNKHRIKPGYDIVIAVVKDVPCFEKLQREFIGLCGKLGLI